MIKDSEDYLQRASHVSKDYTDKEYSEVET